jgi:hypothetical protein
MSWSFHFIGKAVDVNRAIHAERQKYSEGTLSRRELDEAAPHIVALLEQNQSEAATSGQAPDEFLISVRASGSASWKDGQKTSGSCNVEIKRPDGQHVTEQGR